MTNLIGNLLKHLRDTKGLLLREVGALLDINPTVLSKIECGNRFPTRNQIDTLSSFYIDHREEIMTIWLCEKLLFEIKEEEYALPAIHAVMKRLKSLT
ncbi:helix-turn-helix domain-containing protein [Alistipes indistinctus]|jgi:transcriptional regulator with XRE-family HTH domain|uniref:helix-turn-helix domain-containing protein n=1 Tax=Alistipes indistinctus TaxID=626932 RepID=UPI000E4E9782|nr:helix-turn-helix transcriptional regulator [Alistipes indistinctus]